VILISTMIIGGVRAAADHGRAGQADAPIAGRVRDAAGSRRTCAERAVTGAAA